MTPHRLRTDALHLTPRGSERDPGDFHHGLLEEYPEIGHLYRPRSGEAVRTLLYGHYRIAYRIKTDDVVDILGVFHGALDIDRYRD